jgi:hypothetical protein
MSTYMDTLLSRIPLQDPTTFQKIQFRKCANIAHLAPIPFPSNLPSERDPIFKLKPVSRDHSLSDALGTPLAQPSTIQMDSNPISQKSPFPNEDIIIWPEVEILGNENRFDEDWGTYFGAGSSREGYERLRLQFSLKREIKNIEKEWIQSQKEDFYEIPIRQTPPYYAIVNEMENFDEKRAARLVDPFKGRTISERSEGIKKDILEFQMRWMDGLEEFQGMLPWEKPERTKQEQEKLEVQVRKEKIVKLAKAREAPKVQGKEVKERVIWSFDDVSWVKQRIIQPRKFSYAGRFQRRPAESGVEKYGPFGIGGGVEGAGGVKQVVERGLDGEVRLVKENDPKKWASWEKVRKREMIV